MRQKKIEKMEKQFHRKIMSRETTILSVDGSKLFQPFWPMGISEILLFCFEPKTYPRYDQVQSIDTQKFEDENNLEAF